MLVVWLLTVIDHVKRCVGAEFLRHRDDEHAGLASGQEMRRLSEIRAARFHAVVGADRKSDGLRVVAVVVADQEVVRAVGVVEPAFVGGGDAGAEAAQRLGNLLGGQTDGPRAREEREGRETSTHGYCCCRGVGGLRAFFLSCHSLYSASVR